MKICYGYDNEEKHLELNNVKNKTKIKEQVEDLLQIYDWVNVISDEGKDITFNFY